MNINTILCPIDLSQESKAAFPKALDLARTFQAKVLLVHVIDDAFPYPDAFAWTNPVEDFYDTMRTSVREQMEELTSETDTGDVEVEPVILVGRAAKEVTQLAKDRQVDLIVLSTHGRTGLDHALMGSQAEKILRMAPCAVFSFKPEKS